MSYMNDEIAVKDNEIVGVMQKKVNGSSVYEVGCFIMIARCMAIINKDLSSEMYRILIIHNKLYVITLPTLFCSCMGCHYALISE